MCGGGIFFTRLSAFQIRLCGVSNGIIGKIRNEKNLEVSGCGVINLLTRILIGGSKKNQEKNTGCGWVGDTAVCFT